MTIVPQNPPKPPAGGANDAQNLCQQALKLLETHKLAPVPENYAIWYHFALAQNIELVKEIENILKNKVPFSTHTNSYLYNKYIIPDRNSKIINDTAAGANKLLGEVLRAVGDFGGETKHYNEDIDKYVEKISLEIDDPSLKHMVRSLISASSEIRERGEQLNTRLEESRAEIDTLRKNLEQVTNESQRDFLTGVYNRKAFDRLLDEHIVASKGQGLDLCLLMLDIDHFKLFNDKFGHLLGDEVLKIVARSMVDCVRGKDVVARYGGEEFALILPSTPMVGGLKVAESIRSTIAKRELKRKDTGESYGALTVSIGVSQLRINSDTAPSLIKRADEGLYHSKRHGRNRVTSEVDLKN